MSSPVLDRPPGAAADRGPDATGVRGTIVAAAMAAYGTRAFHEVSLPTVAAEADLPLEAVQAQFPTMDDLLILTVGVWQARRTDPLRPIAESGGAVALLRSIIVANREEPALMRVLSAMVNISATPGHPLALPLQQQWVHFHAMIQRTLTHDLELGREPVAMDPAVGTEQLIALYEGLQLQSMLRPHMDVLAAFDRAVHRLRTGWTDDLSKQVWEI